MFIGAALAVSGALMQGITRNYLASPSIMGVSDGSAFIITLCMVLLPQSTSIEMIIYSFIGSAFGAALVFGLASILPGGFTPVRLCHHRNGDQYASQQSVGRAFDLFSNFAGSQFLVQCETASNEP